MFYHLQPGDKIRHDRPTMDSVWTVKRVRCVSKPFTGKRFTLWDLITPSGTMLTMNYVGLVREFCDMSAR